MTEAELKTYFMKMAYAEAKKAYKIGEVPVGAILVVNKQVISKSYNLKESLRTPIGHAEVLCLHRAAKKLNKWRLLDAELYVTLEPCVMCAGALIQARIKKVYFGAFDPKAGALCSVYSIGQDKKLNHYLEFEGGILQDPCSKILSDFFKERRKSPAL
jgi:tRNA(adenine34) deaminase